MMMNVIKKFRIVSWILILFIAQGFTSEFKNVGHSGANFLQIPVEARGAALGNAMVAQVQGVSGLYWNPGAVVLAEGSQVLLSTVNWIADTRLHMLGVVHQMGRFGAVGLQIRALTMDEMEITTEYQPNGTGQYFNAGDYAIGATYALQLTDRFSFGGTVKYVYEYIWEANSAAIAFDFGSLYRTKFYNLRLGMRLSNFGTQLKMEGEPIDNKPEQVANSGLSYEGDPRLTRISEEYDLPQTFHFGIAIDPLQNDLHRLTVAAQASDPNDNRPRLGFGGEYAFREIVMLRLGFKSGYDEQNISAGIGFAFKMGNFSSWFDYAFTNFGILGDIHHLTLRMAF